MEVNKEILKDSPEFIEKIKDISKIDQTSEILNSINFRKGKKQFDLWQYYQAAVIGAIELYEFKKDNFTKKWKGIAEIRENLRILLEFNKAKELLKQEIIIPISLKTSKYDGNYIVEENNVFKPKTRSHANWETIIRTDQTIKIDLSKHPVLQRIVKHRLLRVGFEIFDDFTYGRIKANNEGSSMNTYTQRYWDLELKYNNGKPYDLGSNIKHKVQDVFLANVMTSDRDGTINWSSNKSLINIPIDKPWEMKLDNYNLGHNGNIRDIIVKFHVAYQTK